tara:strand:- start:1442 stop:1912 length:471 start_codon:yes stop_codon:yes gene_type:complete
MPNSIKLLIFFVFLSAINLALVINKEETIKVVEICETETKTVEKLLFQQGVVTATVYNADPKQCNTDYLVTASGFKLDSSNQYQHRIIAVSRNLLNQFSYGDSVYITGTDHYDGWWVIHDTMNKRYVNCVDFLINKKMPIGKWKSVHIYKKEAPQA